MANQLGASAAGIGVGLGTTLAVKHQFDAPTETSIVRPSVIWGVGTGTLAWLIPWFLNWRMSAKREFLQDYGEGAIVAGIVSAVTPGGIQTPTI